MGVLIDDKDAPGLVTEGHEADKWLEVFSLFIHDLEPPLASMKYILKLLDEGKYNPEKATHRELVSSSKVAMHRAETIVYDILAVARSGSVGLPVNMTELDPDVIIDEVASLAQGAAAENDVSVSVNRDGDSPLIKADAGLLARTLDNFIYNGLRHTPTGGEITIYTSVGKASFYIHVKDSGPGFDDIEPGVLFEKFGQINMRAAGKHRGVGLGLYFCMLAATGMKGTVMADNHPDGGAVFSVKLQMVEEK
ncbi:MAG: HAMP domain-containing histidine kinase [candidate division Zixibacteria bacterium]|nr:HAMP domain-containing histidine kinase [candidate division Zixibacteria bacterium]